MPIRRGLPRRIGRGGAAACARRLSGVPRRWGRGTRRGRVACRRSSGSCCRRGAVRRGPATCTRESRRLPDRCSPRSERRCPAPEPRYPPQPGRPLPGAALPAGAAPPAPGPAPPRPPGGRRKGLFCIHSSPDPSMDPSPEISRSVTPSALTNEVYRCSILPIASRSPGSRRCSWFL